MLALLKLCSISDSMGLEELQMQMAAPLLEVMEEVKRKFKEFQEQEPLWDVVMGFVNAVDWTEGWIRALIGAHVALLLLAILTRRRTTIQSVIFGFAALVVFTGERLNKLGSEHWRSFSRQNYFDPHGTFYTTMVSGPLLIVLFIVLINYLVSCSLLLVKAKRMEIQHKARQRSKQEGQKKGEGSVPAGSGGAVKEAKKQK